MAERPTNAGPLFEERDRAESFGAVAEQYDRVRPSYPSALVDGLLEPGVESVLDVGCGTGIAGALFLERGCTVLGVEVDARMAELARGKGLDVEVARFEEWRPDGRLFDLVISAQAWHWIDPRRGAVQAAHALRPGGRIGLFWNFADFPPGVREVVMPIYDRLEPGLEGYSALVGNRDDRAETTLAGIAGSGEFGEAQRRTFPWSKTYDTASWLEQLETHSDHRSLAPERRERLLSAVGEAIDTLGGSFEMPYETILISAVRS
jgi:SAM-dependent methyltransferase